ncbi:tim barrel metal-dependent protein [Fusarium avenaceum]|nr:tim barrel metal-dependent protein [Fusarium avenaceum]
MKFPISVLLSFLHYQNITNAAAMSPSRPPSPPLSITKRTANVSSSADPRMPDGAWDSHLHIMDPVRYPPVEAIPYTPAVHNAWDNAIFEHGIGCQHVFYVQTATHGYDLTLMLDSMRAVGNNRALGLALFDPNTTNHEHIRRWDGEGVRAVRVNLVTYGDDKPIDELKETISKYVELIKPFDWVLQLYTKMERIIELEDFPPTLGVRVVFGSDWPHTRFEGLDVKPWVSHLLDLTEGNQWLRERLFRENALELWGVDKRKTIEP